MGKGGRELLRRTAAILLAVMFFFVAAKRAYHCHKFGSKVKFATHEKAALSRVTSARRWAAFENRG
jgi:hypothetical protein